MKMRIIFLIALLMINLVLNIRVSLTKIKNNNSNNANEMLENQASTEEKSKVEVTAASHEKSEIKPFDPIKSEGKSEEEMYELERANAMAEMIF